MNNGLKSAVIIAGLLSVISITSVNADERVIMSSDTTISSGLSGITTMDGNGGAIANYDGTINVGKNNTFTSNTALKDGGAIYNGNYMATANTTVKGGTSFSQNEAARGGAIYNSGNLKLNTTDGNINFSNNKAVNGGDDVYLDGASSTLTVEGTNANNKVSFNSTNSSSIAGNGTFTNDSAGTVEFVGNKNVSAFTGKYIQKNGKTSLNNSNMFNKYDIQSGEFSLTNGSTATLDNSNGKFANGIIVNVKDANSILNITNGASIAKDSQVNVLGGGKINVNNGSLTLNSDPSRSTINSGDTWTGDISTSAGGNLTLDGFTHSTASGGGNYTQSGGNLNLNNGSNLTLGNAGSNISGGTVNVGSGNTINVEGGSTISGGNINVSGNANIGANGSVTGGNTSVNNGGSLNVNTNGSITGGTTTVNNGGSVNVNGGTIGGNANTTITNGGKVTVDGGTINSTGKTDIQAGSELEIKNNGNVTLDSNDKWNGKVTNTDSNLTLDGVTHNTDNGQYVQNGGNLSLSGNSSLTLGENSSITNGTVNVEDSDFVVDNGGTVTGGEIIVGDGSSFNVNEGATISGGKIDFQGDNVSIGINGSVLADAVFDVTNNTVVIGNAGNVTLDGGATSGDTWTDGAIQLGGGTLNFTGTKNGTNGNFLGDSGNLNISSGSQHFVIGADSYIKDTVAATIDAGSGLDITGGNVTLNGNDTWNGDVNISSGNLTLDGAVKDAGGKFTQSGGTSTVTGDFAMNNAGDKISGGSLNIGTADKAGTITQTNGSIEKEASVNIAGNSTLDIQGGKTTINGTGADADSWNGTIKLAPTSELNVSGVTTNGTLLADGGNLNITDSSNLGITNGSFIMDGTTLKLDSDSQMTVQNNGTVHVGDDDTWEGTIGLKDGGILNYSGTAAQDGTLKADGGNLNTLAGSLLEIKQGSYISEAVNADIEGMLSIKGLADDNRGQVTLSSGDKITGDVTIGDYGTLNLGDNVVMAESGQKIEFTGPNAEMNLNTNNNLDLKAEITGNAGEINKEGSGNVLFSGSTSNYKGNLTINNSGNLIFTDADGFGGNLLFGDIEGKEIGIIADTVKGTTTLDKDADITYSTYRDVDLVFGDTVSVAQGSITALAKDGQSVIFEKEATITNGGELNASGKNVTFTNGIQANGNPVTRADNNGRGVTVAVKADEKAEMNDVVANNASIGTIAGTTEFKSLSLTNSDLYIMKNGFTSNNMNIDGISTISVMNGVLTNNTVGDMLINDGSTGNFAVDISARDWASDKILSTGITSGGIGTLNVSDFQFINKCPIDRYIALKIFGSTNSMENIIFSATDKEVFTPIGYYKLMSQGGGNYTASLTRYNPQVFRGQVATVASYQNQLVVNNMMFDHMQEVGMQYLAEKNANKYAAAYPQFAPYQYNRKDGSLWFKSFGTFERLNMSQGLNVNNNFYGALVGADFAAKELGNGWTFMPTAYVGYTGGHQTYANMSMSQNGGQGGAMGTFMKDEFIGSLLVYGGGFGNMMDVAGHTDDTGNWFVGSAAKAAYNFHPAKHFIIQPTALVSYNMFGQQNWSTNFGQMNMQSGMLNGVNVAPGVNLIYGRETWSIYATMQYFYNIMGYSEGRAGNVNLPGIGMRHGFLEYGIGATKTWKDRFSAYLQIVIRNGGRTGIGFQGGLMYRL